MKELNWNELTFEDKLRLIEKWSFVSILANIFQIIGSVCSIQRQYLSATTPDKLQGIGCMLACFNMIRYLLKTKNYKTMITSFAKSAPYVLRALISMLPLLIGYSFLGMSIFWECKRF